MSGALLQHTFALTLTSLAVLLLGLLVFFAKRSTPLGKIFLFYCTSISWWSLFQALHQSLPDPKTSLLAAQLMTAGGSFLIPSLFLHFVITLLDVPRPTWLLRGMYGASAMFAVLSFTPLLVQPPTPTLYLYNFFSPGPIYPIGVAFFIGMITIGHYWLYRKFATSSGQTKNQFAYLFFSSALGYLGGSANFLLVFDIDIPLLNPWGTYAVPLYVAATSYAIARYRLMDISVVIHKGVAYGFLLAAIFIPTYLAVAASERATLYSIPPLLAGTLVAACGVWVLMNQPHGLINITFGMVCGAISVWLFSFFMVYSSTDEAEARFWGRCVYAGVVYIPAAFYHFSSNLMHRWMSNRLIASNYFISTIFLLLIPTPYLLSGDYAYFWGHYPKAGLLHPLFLMYFGLAGGFSLFRIYQGYLAAQHINARDAARLRTLFWAFAVGYLSSLDFAQAYGHEFYPAGYVLASISILIVTRTIITYQSPDSAVMPTSPRAEPYLQALSLIPVYIAVLLLIRLFTGSTQYLLAGVLLATFLVFAGVLSGIQKRVEKAIERMLFRQRHDAYETLIEFSKAMVTILDLSALNSTIMDTLARVLGIEKISVFLLDKERNQYFLAAAHGLDFDEMKTVTFSSSARLPQHLARTRSIVLLEELRQDRDDPSEQAVIDTLQVLHAELCIPLVNKDRLIGFFNFGKRASRSMYSEADLALLTTLAQNAAVALDNAMLYEDLRRSRLLMRRTDRLRSLETIAGGFAHEIRNPLTSIKTFVQLAPERKHDDEFIGHFSQIVHEDVLRIERLIQEILDYARYMEPKFSLENLNDIISSCLYFIEVKAESKNISVEKDFVRTLPSIMLDRQQIKQVLLNLLINAMEAMGDRGGRLTVRTRGLSKPGGDFWIQIEVQDTGPGIAPADMDHIFDPFYTTKHHSEEREGTGLGLTIVHQIVQEHHGYIEVESQPGRGTTFFINLPIRQPEDLFARERMDHEKTDSVGR